MEFLVIFYSQMLYMLMEQNKFEERDYYKLVAKVWELDSNLLDYRVFKKKWEKICNLLEVPIKYDDNEYLSDKLVEPIALKLFDNRHVFQQYTEQSERMKKKTDEIMNDL